MTRVKLNKNQRKVDLGKRIFVEESKQQPRRSGSRFFEQRSGWDDNIIGK
jgi:hypothetical protein